MINRLKKFARRLLGVADDDDDNVVIIIRPAGGAYCWIFDHANRGKALRAMGRAASDPDLDFDWADAALACDKVSMLCEQGRGIAK